ncbi:hypothetical protein PR048_026644 [Dryococelus australis]|uniref:Uncharacterized protein n=1 Tax=Dryococelus australis TaxID=614101 RepID=A0ABQ9GLY3_9NEOP|nr:hypothetical protein PR048_026644 [Dryococelus australis]
MFNKQWLDYKLNPEFAGWLNLVPDLSSLVIWGGSLFFLIAKGPKHIKNSQSTCLQPTISFFSKSTRSEQCDVPSLPSCSSHTSNSSLPDSSCISSAPVLQQTNVKTFAVNEDNVTSAEILLALGIVAWEMSLISFIYVINHGLAPYFKECLQSDLNSCSDYIFCFNESGGAEGSNGHCCTLLGSQPTKSLYTSLEQCFLRMCNCFRKPVATFNGWAKCKSLNVKTNKVESPDGKSLLDVGSCGLHTVNGAVKMGHQTAGWGVYCVVGDMYAKYTELSGSKDFHFKFTSVKWLENGACVQKALKIYHHVQKFAKEESILANHNHNCLK